MIISLYTQSNKTPSSEIKHIYIYIYASILEKSQTTLARERQKHPVLSIWKVVSLNRFF